MRLVPFEPHMAPDLARCYNDLVAPMPYSRPVPEAWFADLTPSQWQRCTEEEILVAQEGGEIVGFVHVGVSAPPNKKWDIPGEPGVIRLLSYRPGQRPVGAALLEAAERWLLEHERTEVVAGCGCYMYAFYPVFGHISECISHLPPLLGMAGYENHQTEVFFHWPDFTPPEASLPSLGVEVVGERTRTQAKLIVRQGEQQVGECRMTWMVDDPWHPQFADWCDCDYLGLDEPFQGKGLGRYLLARGLTEMRAAGARHARINTDWNNYRAYLFYTNLGYRFLDRTFGFQKELGNGPSSA